MISYKVLLPFLISIILLATTYFLHYENNRENIFYLLPCLFVILQFLIFTIFITKKTNNNVFSDIGFIYVSFMVLYTISPAVNIISGISEYDPIAILKPSFQEIYAQLWRQSIFILSFIFGYIFIRRDGTTSVNRDNFNKYDLINSIAIFTIILIFIYLYLIIMSAPVETYYDAYLRYDNLPWVLKKIASVCIRFKIGIYTILLSIIFIKYKIYKLFIPFFIALICIFELYYTRGARIQILTIIIQSLCLYSILISPVGMKKIVLISFISIIFFTFIEIIRLVDFENTNDFIDNIININFQLPWELNSVFYTGLHLYMERIANTLPVVEWPMFFYDFISVFTFNDFLLWNPTDWYYRNYYPNAPVAPFTLSPIADSAIWGGNIDLVIRGILNGCFFAIIFNLFIYKKNNIIFLISYVFLCSLCIITFKYSIFYLITPFIKNLVPCLLFFILINKFNLIKK